MKSEAISGSPAFVKAEKFYELLQELQLDMLDCRKANDVNGMMDTFGDIYIFVFPFIEQHLGDLDLEDFSEVKGIMKTQMGADTDFSDKHNFNVISEAKISINKKRKILSKLMAKAGIYTPINPNRDKLPGALGSDDIM